LQTNIFLSPLVETGRREQVQNCTNFGFLNPEFPESADVPRSAEVVFIGGSTNWKRANIAVFRRAFDGAIADPARRFTLGKLIPNAGCGFATIAPVSKSV
jgi:hypothetical protein